MEGPSSTSTVTARARRSRRPTGAWRVLVIIHVVCGEVCWPGWPRYNPSALRVTARFMRLFSACFEPDKCLLIACSEPVRVACSKPQLFGCMAVSAMTLLEFLEWLEGNAGPGEINRPASRQTGSGRPGDKAPGHGLSAPHGREGVRIGFHRRRPRRTLKGRQTQSEMGRVGLRLRLRKQQAEWGDIVLLYGDASEALTHPCLARHYGPQPGRQA